MLSTSLEDASDDLGQQAVSANPVAQVEQVEAVGEEGETVGEEGEGGALFK